MRGQGEVFRTRRFGLAAVILPALVAASPVRAEDGGILGFFRSLGGGGEPAPAAAPAPTQAVPHSGLRPLTVRRTKPRAAAAAKARAHFARVPAKMGPVTIYTDPTLRGGDAVMTKEGVRVFAGAAFSADRPYSDADFVAVSASKSLNPNLRKTATDLNKLPHS